MYKDDLKSNHVLLTLASKYGTVGKISIEKSRKNNDFGEGFYCLNSYDKSVSFLCRFPDASVYFLDYVPSGLKRFRSKVNTE